MCVAGSGVSANSALSTAAGLASKAAPLVQLPHWVCMPSNTAQHWLRYTFMTAFSAWAAIFLYRSSSLFPVNIVLALTLGLSPSFDPEVT